MPDASIIIPTFNGAHWLEPCLSSLRQQSAWGRFEVIVVDDGSTDGTDAVLRQFDWVRVVRKPDNRGFASAVNDGIRQAHGGVIVLLNNDTEADPRWLEELLGALHASGATGSGPPSARAADGASGSGPPSARAADGASGSGPPSAPAADGASGSGPPGRATPHVGWQAGMATSKVLTLADRHVLHTTGDTLNIAGVPANRGVWEEDRGQWDQLTDVFGASGAAGAYTRHLLDTVGLFEERFDSYLEDVDLAWRARLAGFGCVFAPRAVVYHGVSSTGGGTYASFHVGRNRVWLLVRNYPSRPFRTHWREIVGALWAVAWDAVRHFRGAEARATLGGLLTGLALSPGMLGARREIQSRRVIDDGAFEALVGDPEVFIGPGTPETGP